MAVDAERLGSSSDTDESAAVKEAILRDEKLSSGRVTGRTHEEVMQAARRALECD